jgi:exodeoxyribonuclease V beta subunit
MKGFMDMVFRHEDHYYLVDWKSNFLGPSVEDYNPEAMALAMIQNFYTFQYMIYTLALNRYLRLRDRNYDYEKHFGGVLYVFLRGVDPAKGSQFGIYRDKPPGEVIENLSEAMMGAGMAE